MVKSSFSSKETLELTSGPVSVELDSALAQGAEIGERYQPGILLGRGGMGEIRLCRDLHIGRDVALKTMRADTAGAALEARFLREARVQAQLEHPGVVPVYDLGAASGSGLYFTMKRVRGATLQELISDLRQGVPETRERFSTRRLLSLFNQACLTVDYAHQHGVLHRDIKPENIMVGDFGEVYVLDWGLAKIFASSSDAATQRKATAQGAVLGTPGYMSPEQILATDELDARSDVFALGAVLFELLALEPLVRAETEQVQSIFTATLRGPDARVSVRAPARDGAPELDAICVRATAVDPTERFPSARALSEAIERFLDGDRDLELRRRLASDHVQAAWSRLAGSHLGLEERTQIMADVGQALALDPGNSQAMQALVQLLSTPTKEVPREVRQELEQRENQVLSFARRSGTGAYASFLLFLPLLLWMGIKSWAPVVIMLLFAALATAGSVLARAGRWFTPLFYASLVTSTVAIGASTTIFGPFLLSPSLAAVNVLALCLIRPRRGAPWPLVASIGACAVLVPAFLQSLGWADTQYSFVGGVMSVLPSMVELQDVPSLIVLLVVSLMLIALPAAVFGQTRSALDAAELELRMQAWHLRHLAPTSAGGRR